MKICCISDTHESHRDLQIEECELVLFAGDLTNLGNEDATRDFLKWLQDLPCKQAFFIAGNHDKQFAEYKFIWEQESKKYDKITYLEESIVQYKEIKIYGSPYSPKYGNWWFMEEENRLRRRWGHIPNDIDIMIVHTPPKGILDTYDDNHVGSQALRERIVTMSPKLLVCGHIHSGYGIDKYGLTTIVNASVTDNYYELINPPIYFNY